jgi:hypothetical protein
MTIIGDIHGHADELEVLLEHLSRHGHDRPLASPHPGGIAGPGDSPVPPVPPSPAEPPVPAAPVNGTGDKGLVFLGDLIDKGPTGDGSVRVLRIVDDLVLAGKADALLGNHEDMMLSEFGLNSPTLDRSGGAGWWRSAYGAGDWLRRNDGHRTYRALLEACGIDEYARHPERSEEESVAWLRDNPPRGWSSPGFRRAAADPRRARFVRALCETVRSTMLDAPVVRLRIPGRNILCVHGGVDPRRPQDDQDVFNLLWARNEFLSVPGDVFADGGWPFIVHGHNFRQDDPGHHGGDSPTWRLNLDGGVILGWYLLGWVVEENLLLGVREGGRVVEENPEMPECPMSMAEVAEAERERKEAWKAWFEIACGRGRGAEAR